MFVTMMSEEPLKTIEGFQLMSSPDNKFNYSTFKEFYIRWFHPVHPSHLLKNYMDDRNEVALAIRQKAFWTRNCWK